MKTLIKHSFISRLFIMLAITQFWSCEDEAEIEDTRFPQELIGTWYFTDGEVYIEITTNSAQTMVDRLSEGIGSIGLGGQETASMTYMFANDYGDGVSILLTNQPLVSQTPILPMYMMSLISNSSDTIGTIIAIGESDTTYYTASEIDLSYESASYTLTVNSAEFMPFDLATGEMDTSQIVTANGTLQSKVVSIPANTATRADVIGSIDDIIGSLTLILKAEGEIQQIMVTGFSGGTEIDTLIGTWEADGNQLVIIDEYDDDGVITIDTTRLDYVLSGNTLSIHNEANMCDENDGGSSYVEECLNEWESEYGLDPGSLISLVAILNYNFSKTAPAVMIAPSPIPIHLLQLPSLPEKRMKHKLLR